MTEKTIFENKAVSSVISVILMVAVAVILAAIVATFALGIAEDTQPSAPGVNFNFETGTTAVDDGNSGDTYQATSVTISHAGGDQIEASNLEVTVNGNGAFGVTSGGVDTDGDNNVVRVFTSGDVSTGSEATIVSAASGIPDSIGNYEYNTKPPGNPNNLDIFDGDVGSSSSSVAAQDVRLASGDTVRVVYNPSGGGQSSLLARYEIP